MSCVLLHYIIAHMQFVQSMQGFFRSQVQHSKYVGYTTRSVLIIIHTYIVIFLFTMITDISCLGFVSPDIPIHPHTL